MKRFLVVLLLALAAVVSTSDNASAQYPANFGFFPWGFYQPYGARYGNSNRTPPYFATNPPVYYGARHSRPYGLSPFASPPLVLPGGNYKSRLRNQFLQPRVPTPGPQSPVIHCNPCVSHSKSVKSKDVAASRQPAQIGPVRSNPFVDSIDRIALKQ